MLCALTFWLLLAPVGPLDDDTPAGLLHREEVQAELNMTDQQKRDWEKTDPLPKVKRGGTFEPDVLVIPDPVELDKKNAAREARAWAMLGPSQVMRLHELTVQRAGVRALLREDVRSSLGLSDGQREMVRRAKSRHDLDLQALIDRVKRSRVDQKRVVDRWNEIESALTDALGQILTPDQEAALLKLGGKPFHFLTHKFG